MPEFVSPPDATDVAISEYRHALLRNAPRPELAHLAAALDVPTISLFGPTNPGLTGAYGRTQIHQASDWPCAPCLQKKCTYKPSADDLRRFDLKREWPLCFTRLNPEHVASRLSALLLAEDVR